MPRSGMLRVAQPFKAGIAARISLPSLYAIASIIAFNVALGRIALETFASSG